MGEAEAVILTAGGRYVNPLDLDPRDVDIEDIARALSNLSRYTGHFGGYSVAEHSVRVAEAIERAGYAGTVVLWGLLHDASEAYLGDVSRTLKHRPEFTLYREAEASAMEAVAIAFKLSPSGEPGVVKLYDRVLLATERRDLLPKDGNTIGGVLAAYDFGFSPYIDDVEPLPEQIVPWGPDEAERRFLAIFDRLSLVPRPDVDLVDETGEVVATVPAEVADDVDAEFAAFRTTLRSSKTIVDHADALGVEPETILQEADRLVSYDRQADYGHPLDDFSKVSGAAKCLGIDPTSGPDHHALYMVIVKIAREVNRPKRDNRVDGAGYFKTLDMVIEERARRADEALKASDPERYRAEVEPG